MCVIAVFNIHPCFGYGQHCFSNNIYIYIYIFIDIDIMSKQSYKKCLIINKKCLAILILLMCL